MKCDFCSSPLVRWVFPAESFSYSAQGITSTSDGDWAACDICHSYILNGDWNHLAIRSMETMLVQLEEYRMQIRTGHLFEEFKYIHGLFRVHRAGPPHPIGPPLTKEAQ